MERRLASGRRRVAALALWSTGVLLGPGCSGSGPPTPGDATADARIGADGGTDAASDAQSDARADAALPTCPEDACSDRGACSIEGGEIQCRCDRGYVGAHCEECDAENGFFDDGAGGCTDSPCEPNPCGEEGRTRCVVEGGEQLCLCDAGSHDEGGRCVPDTTCMEGSCNMHGTCMEVEEGIACGCDEGWTGTFCGECDDTAGYHPDGRGGCTTDPCLPNPCGEPHRGTCVAEEPDFRCDCDAGFHLEGDVCVADESCDDGTCSGHGSCAVVDGRTQCSCDEGWSGAACESCDADAGYHADGQGGCTTDPCMPNPCTAPNRTTCVGDDGSARCDCNEGYHEDGVGGCTQDPCTPNPCAASGQACRDAGDGNPECYTPTCDDGNPCTADSLEGGECVFTSLPDGTGCSTTLCEGDQTCAEGICGGGTPVSCDDGNPCTEDSCDPVTGCAHEANDGLMPDDGVACTTDSCSAGSASHVPDDTACDDELYCNGSERCTPGDPSADGAGCVSTSVPEPPPSTPCRRIGECDEDTDSFPETVVPAGGDCEDGIACTTGDTCDAEGTCRGSVTTSCDGTTCSGTTAPPSAIDIPVAHVTGTITQNGAPLPATSYYGSSVTFYLVSKDTGTWHTLTDLDFDGDCCVNYDLQGDGTYETRMVAGVYDLLYRRRWNDTSRIVSANEPMDAYVNGLRLLREDVVVPAGPSTLDIDIPVTEVSGTITQNGGSLPATSYYGSSVTFYAVSKDTGSWHTLTDLDFDGDCCVNYDLQGDGTYATRLPSGRYDILYRRRWNSSSEIVSANEPMDAYVNGLRLLQQDVLIDGATQTLDIDIPVTEVSGTITQNGGPLPATSYYGSSVTFYAVSKDTDTWHTLTDLDFDGDCCVDYDLQGDGTYATRLPSGRYDILYRRRWNSSSEIVSANEPMDAYVNGLRLLQQDVLIDGATQTLDIDIPVTEVSGAITMDGSPLPEMSYYGSAVTFYLIAQDTGAWHTLTDLDFDGDCCVNYDLQGDGTYTTRAPSGIYDLVYRRRWSDSTGIVSDNEPRDAYINGLRILQRGIELSGTAQTLNVDIPTSAVTGSYTQDGGPLPEVSYYGSAVTYYAVPRGEEATGNPWHTFDNLGFDGDCCVNYTLQGDGTFDERLPSGVYDILYRRRWSASSGIVSANEPMDAYVNGLRVLHSCIAVP